MEEGDTSREGVCTLWLRVIDFRLAGSFVAPQTE